MHKIFSEMKFYSHFADLSSSTAFSNSNGRGQIPRTGSKKSGGYSRLV